MNDRRIGWKQLFDRADAVIQSQLIAERDSGRTLLLQPKTRAGSLLLLAVGLLWPHAVILDEKNVAPDSDAIPFDESKIPNELLPSALGIRGGEGIDASRFETWNLSLCTSGSTGEPKLIRKSGAGLWAEVRDLAPIYRWNAGSSVLSLVSPLHIYGLLHSFLLPMSCGAGIEFVNFQDGPVDPGELLATDYAGVIAVPATWSFVKDLLEKKTVETLIMSGAPFGDKRRQELQNSRRKPAEAWEILGSTETGGLGYRCLLTADDAFQLLTSVRIEGDHVASPYLLPELRLPLADHLEMLPGGRFLHRGRMDRIFKYAGQRYALGEVEKALSQCTGNAETWVRFHSDEKVAQGGWLEGWIESAVPVDRAILRAAYQSITRAPFPQIVHYLEVFPRDAQGKLQIALIAK